MQIIEGRNVDLIAPFPLGEIKRIYGWTFCYKTLCEADFSPKTQEDFVQFMSGLLPNVLSWGIIDKNHTTNIKHEAPLVGVVMFEPSSPNTGYFHVATARRSWKTGLVDEAVELVIEKLFEENPTLTRLGVCVLRRNAPAISLAKRHKFQYEGTLRDVVTQGGEPQDMVSLSLTRRDWLCHKQSPQPSVSEEASSVVSQEVENNSK